jgi:hypothetical protein
MPTSILCFLYYTRSILFAFSYDAYLIPFGLLYHVHFMSFAISPILI